DGNDKVINNKAFSSSPSSDALNNFVNKLGYPKLVRNLSNVRIWEEFTQSIHTFIEDKKNLAQHTHGKKKATLIMIPSIRFTKLIIYHLQRKHKFHPRPDSPLHLPNEELVLGYLKFIPKAALRPPVSKPASSQQPKPKPAPAKSQGKKRKLVTEISDKPSQARKSRPCLRKGKEKVTEEQVARDLLTLQTHKKKSPDD
nr:hypothetical protein [Tanacetum cinerariifolium]